jgi:hypothetical protein
LLSGEILRLERFTLVVTRSARIRRAHLLIHRVAGVLDGGQDQVAPVISRVGVVMVREKVVSPTDETCLLRSARPAMEMRAL